ncbi:uncharacterized protein LOC123532872 isoform X2 [Mercenaria mercenaria]|uniref:uncharacterized protein LOC123532872 isoform X2 n=1 Tax=Mercenaria mercenaria TaxID=6596 RepID=UPI00234F8A2C|nr:uncharacterized protein LOC123532872 isoform X2 [Mercenaria mercenaria]
MAGDLFSIQYKEYYDFRMTTMQLIKKLEPLFQSRWDDETEMDKGLKILKRKHAATVRLRKLNDVYDRLLVDKIRVLDTNLSHVEKELTKETRFIKEEIREFKPVLQFPRIDSATPVESRSSSRLSGRNQTDKLCQSCMFDSTNTNLRCRHFPCYLPATYNSITFTSKPQTYSVVSNYNQLLQRCKDLRPSTSHTRQNMKKDEVNIETEPHPPRNSTKEKIRGLKQLVKEMKERNEKTKPRDWAVNYGDPVPRRIILKPVKTI